MDADARAAREHARPARRGAMRDAQLRVLTVGDDVLGVQLAVRDHLCQRHHRGGVRTDRVRGDDVDVGVLRRLRGCDAAVDANLLLFTCNSWHFLLRVRLKADTTCDSYADTASDSYVVSGFSRTSYFQFSMSFGACVGTACSSAACRPCSPCVIANAVSMRTTPVSKSNSGTPSRQPVGHSSMQTRHPLQ